MSADERMFWRLGTCRVWVGYTDDGGLLFSGEDRKSRWLDEYGISHRVTVR